MSARECMDGCTARVIRHVCVCLCVCICVHVQICCVCTFHDEFSTVASSREHQAKRKQLKTEGRSGDAALDVGLVAEIVVMLTGMVTSPLSTA